MNEIVYSRAGLEDIDEIVDNRITFLQELQGSQPADKISALRQETRKYFYNTIKNETYYCWLARANGEIVGIGGMAVREHPGNFKNPEGKKGYIMNMYTRPDYRKRGISIAILKNLVDTAKENGIKSFELHATKMGEPVYQKFGFKLHDEPTYRMWE